MNAASPARKDRLLRFLRVALPLVGTVGGLSALKLLGTRFVISPEKAAALVDRVGAWGPPVFILFLGVRPLLLLPGQALAAVAGMLWGGPLGAVIALCGSALSSVVTVQIGRRLRGPIERLTGCDHGELSAIARHYDLPYAIVMTMNPLIPTDVCIAVGAAAGARWSRLSLGAVLGSIPGTIATATFGSALAHGHLPFMELTIAGWVVSLIGGVWIGHNVTRKLREQPRVKRAILAHAAAFALVTPSAKRTAPDPG